MFNTRGSSTVTMRVDEPEVSCEHGVTPLLTARTTKNSGRQFYACKLGKDHPNKCTFFQWKEETPGQDNVATAASHTPVRSALVTPSKRPRTPPGRAAAVAAQLRAEAPASQEEVRDMIDDISDDDQWNFANEDRRSPIEPTEDTRPIKKFRFNTHVSGIVTPPKTNHRFEKRPMAPQTPTTSKFRHTHGETPTSPTPRKTQWEMITDDPDNPFHARSATLQASLATMRTADSAVQNTPSTSRTPMRSGEDYVSAVEALHDLPEYIQWVERKFKSHAKSEETKMEIIKDLKKEVEIWKRKCQELEGTIGSFRAGGYR